MAVIRTSGPASATALRRLTGRDELPRPRAVALRRIRDPGSAEPLDRGLVVWFPGERGAEGYPVPAWALVLGCLPGEPWRAGLQRRGQP